MKKKTLKVYTFSYARLFNSM